MHSKQLQQQQENDSMKQKQIKNEKQGAYSIGIKIDHTHITPWVKKSPG